MCVLLVFELPTSSTKRVSALAPYVKTGRVFMLLLHLSIPVIIQSPMRNCLSSEEMIFFLLRLHLPSRAPILSVLSRLAYLTVTGSAEVTSSGTRNKEAPSSPTMCLVFPDTLRPADAGPKLLNPRAELPSTTSWVVLDCSDFICKQSSFVHFIFVTFGDK